jgi:hypothetical protein
LENKKNSSDTVQFSDISGYLKSAVICPAGGTAFSDSYTMPGSVTNKPSCQKQPNTHLLPLDTTS